MHFTGSKVSLLLAGRRVFGCWAVGRSRACDVCNRTVFRPCYHSCRVRTDKPVARANSAWDMPEAARAANNCHCGPTWH